MTTAKTLALRLVSIAILVTCAGCARDWNAPAYRHGAGSIGVMARKPIPHDPATRTEMSMLLMKPGYVEVTRVIPDGPGDRAGIHRGDLILGVVGQPKFRTAREAIQAIRTLEPGTRAELWLRRAGKTRKVTVEVASVDAIQPPVRRADEFVPFASVGAGDGESDGGSGAGREGGSGDKSIDPTSEGVDNSGKPKGESTSQEFPGDRPHAEAPTVAEAAPPPKLAEKLAKKQEPKLEPKSARKPEPDAATKAGSDPAPEAGSRGETSATDATRSEIDAASNRPEALPGESPDEVALLVERAWRERVEGGTTASAESVPPQR